MNAEMYEDIEITEGFFVGDYEADPNGEHFSHWPDACYDQRENGGEIFETVELHIDFPWGDEVSYVTTVERAKLN